MTPAERYPALMAYIEDRSASTNDMHWCEQLRLDTAEAERGGLADVAAQLRQARADYGAYPYNSAMGKFLGLPIRPGNNEPPHGYYMAGQVMAHYALGEARREAERLIAEGKPLRVVAARCKRTRKPVRFHTFVGPEQVRIEHGAVAIWNGKVKGTLSSSWSVETAMVRLATALRTGVAWGEATEA